MAAKSGGTDDWSPAMKLLLAASQSSVENDFDISEFVKHILKSETVFTLVEEEYETFLTAFAALALDYISRYANTLPKSQIQITCQACKILLHRLISKLSKQQSLGGDAATAGVSAVASVFTTKQLLSPIRAVCTGQSMLAASEEAVLLGMLKNAKAPPQMRGQVIKEKDPTQGTKESTRVRCDLSSRILEHLTVPWQDFSPLIPVPPDNPLDTGNKTSTESAGLSENNSESKIMFIGNNVTALRSMGAGDALLEMCLSLPQLSRYTRKYQAYLSKKGFSLPASPSEAHAIRHSLHSVVADINIVHSAASLPLWEPLTSNKLQKLSLLSMSCLYCSISNATASSIVGITNAVSPKCNTIAAGNAQTSQTAKNVEDDYDTLAITVVERSLEIFGQVSGAIKSSTRAGGHILQNHLLIGVWLLVAGLQAQLSASSFSAADKGKEEKGKSPSKARDGSGRINLMKVQQGFGVLSVALASHALTLMSALLEDASVEVANDPLVAEPAPLDILSTATALQRAVTFLQAVPLNHLLFYLATISYRKACSLKRVQKHPLEGDALSQSDSTTYYDDLLSCSDNSTDEEEDSEPILGVLFEESIAPSDASSANTSKEASSEATAERTATAIVPDNREPHGYISLATKIFQFMNQHLISSKSAYVREYVVNGLVEQQMVILAAIIRDLDHETSRTETGTIPAFYGAALGAMYSDFSRALSRYTHNLLACNMLSESLQNTLLQHLGVSPWTAENSVSSAWPLQVLPRTLGVLAQVLLLKPQSEKEAACISIWHRLVTTLVENVCNAPATFEAENEDLNVEHAQLLLFLFHSLNLMQKKSVLLVTGSGAVRCSEAIKLPMKDSQLLHLSRLLLLLEYMMRHLYDAPRSLPDQVEWNLFSATSADWEAKDGGKSAARVFTPWLEIEENYRKYGPQDEFSMRPRFYNLSAADFNNQDALKLDGLACNFILGTPDKMKYPLLVDALIDILNVLHQTDLGKKTAGDAREKISFTGLCAIQSCFSICWRLLLLLPPSTPYMEKLALGEEIPAGPMLLYSLVWGPRAAYKSFTSWMKDCLVKQGMYTQYAENLLKTVSSTVNSLKYDVTLAKNCISSLQPERHGEDRIQPKAALPKLGSLCILAAVIGKLQVLLDEGITKTQSDNLDSTKSPRTPDNGGTASTAIASSVATNVGASKTVLEILPYVLSLTEAIFMACRSSMLYEMYENSEQEGKYSLQDYLILDHVIALAGTSWATEASMVTSLPNSVRTVLDKWRSINVPNVPWNTYANDIIPAESYILTTVNHHVGTLSEYPSFSINPSLKNLLHSLVSFMVEHLGPAAAPDNAELRSQAVDVLISLSMDARTEYLQEMTNKALTQLLGETDSESRQIQEHLYVLNHTYSLILDYTKESPESTARVCVAESILKRCIRYWEQLLEKPVGRNALDCFFLPNKDRSLVSVLLCITSAQASQQFSTCILHFFNMLFTTEEKSNDGTLARLCASVMNFADVDSEKLQIWLKQVILGGSNISPCSSTTNVQTPTMTTTNAMVMVTSGNGGNGANGSQSGGGGAGGGGITEEAQKSEESNDGKDYEQARWALFLSDGPVGRNPAMGTSDGDQHSSRENSRLLRALTRYIVREKNTIHEDIPVTILRALIPIAYHVLSPAVEGHGFGELMHAMSTLADAGSEKGHTLLFKAATEWVGICKEQLLKKDLQSPEKPLPYIEAGCCILNYVADIVAAVCPQTAGGNAHDRAGSPPWEGTTPVNDVNDSDWIDDIAHEDEDSAAEDSDEDSLCNKLCTFTITQKEFMSQHWYHCHTCNMLDGVGVCTICCRVCHRGHDVTYSKYGNFFCDCGAKEDGSCQALTKRSPQTSEHQTANSLSSIGTEATVGTGAVNIGGAAGASANGGSSSGTTTGAADTLGSSGSSSGGVSASSSSGNPSGIVSAPTSEGSLSLSSRLRRRSSSPVHSTAERHERYEKQKDKQRQASLAKQLETSKEWIHDHLWKSGLIPLLVELTGALVPAVESSCRRNSAVGCHARAQAALRQLHSLEKKFEHTDQLMLSTLGSQEGAFENVRMNFSGDQGQTIRQLLSAHMIRRVAMCCLSSPHGKRQHLAVSHEKGKITVLQLSALLKQTDSSKRKLTLTRLGSAPVPFTVLSISGNQWNEDFLAVCGFKDCHVLTFNSSGSVSDHLVLHPQLETGNFIIKAIWLPGSQTQLALVTADFVKIYDLAKDALCPQYYFLVPAGKIRDCTFMHTEDGTFHLLIMSSAGYIYGQAMNEESSAKHGPFYLTSTLDVYHPDIKDNGQVGSGGVSIYYSHALQLLFFSYASGKSFIAPLKSMTNDITVVFQINLAGSSAKSNGNKSNNSQPQPLCQWSEVPNHPGLVCSVLQMSNNPVILMIKPDSVLIQEIKVVPAKAKIMDMVVSRHPSSNAEHRTTLILLCEDGSLRIYMAGMEQTGYWMSPTIQPSAPHSSAKPLRKKKSSKAAKPSGSVNFPVDFFEHCQLMNDVEFGGNDLLQIYNVTQIKHRLNTTGLYVVSTKTMGFNVEVTNNDPVLVMTGIRVLLGYQDVLRAPLFVEIFGRTIQTNLIRSRWFDIPLTREESLQADKKLVITFGPSQDPEGVIMVDSIKVYGKTKDAIGWPEETEDIPAGQQSMAAVPTNATANEADNSTVASGFSASIESPPMDSTVNIERMVANILEVVELSFNFAPCDDSRLSLRTTAIDVASKLLILPAPVSLQMHTTALLAALHTSKQAYHYHKDQVLLSHVLESLRAMRETEDARDIDAEDFYRLVLIVRSISVARPQNLAKFTEQYGCRPIDEASVAVFEKDRAPSQAGVEGANANDHPLIQLMEILWSLHMAYPKNMALAPVVVPGLTHAEATVHAIVEIIHAFTSCDVECNVPLTAKLYLQLLLSSDSTISFSAKQAIVRVLRPRCRRKKVYIPSPPTCGTPDTRAAGHRRGTATEATSAGEAKIASATASGQAAEREAVEAQFPVDANEVLDQVASQLGTETNQHAASSSSSSSTGPSGARSASSGRIATVGRAINPLVALLAPADMPQMYPMDAPPYTDDEAMMELAIALSLQDQESESLSSELQALRQGFQQQAVPNLQGLQGLQNLRGSAAQTLRAIAQQVMVQEQGSSQGQEGAGHYSDTTASAGASDDECSAVVTDGNAISGPSVAQGPSDGSKGSDSGGSGSDSGGSAVDSITGEHTVSGRSSAYGDNIPENLAGGVSRVARTSESNTMSLNAPTTFTVTERDESVEQEPTSTEQENETSGEAIAKLHTVRLLLLDQLMQFIPNLSNVSGVLAIPFMQVILMLTSDLDGQEERDRASIERLLLILVDELEMHKPDTNNICQRSNKREVHLVIMRLLSVLMSRSKYTSKAQAATPNFVSRSTATILSKAGVIDYCLALLKALLEYWKTTSTEENASVSSGQLLKEHPATAPPNMTPFFLCQYVKGHAGDVFEPYPQLLTEMALRLPYQVHKYADQTVIQPAFEQPWYFYLCEYMMSYQTPFVRRQVRKLLLFICGNKEKYRQLRDVHALISHIQSVQQCCTAGGYDPMQSRLPSINLPYDSLVELIEHLKCCVEIATSRTGNWQRFCLKQNTVLSNLFAISTLLDDNVSSTVLQLLQCAVCSSSKSKEAKDGGKASKEALKSSTVNGNKERRERERSEDSDTETKFEEAQCQTLVEQIQKQVPTNLLTKFVRIFLLETNNTNVRWQAHSLMLAIYKNSGASDQEVLLDLLWRLWPLLPAYGRKAAQFVDLLGYFSLKTPQASKKMHFYMEQAVAVLHAQNQLLARHPNASLYANLAQFVELDGYYLESEPCLVCNNPEVAMTTIKLSSIKVDSKFTTTTQIVKLVGSHTISRITLRMGDLKRTKMVRTVNIYYNNRSVQAVVELKNRPAMWHKAKKITLAQGQTEIKMEFPLPIVACNLMIEYADFYENIQASSETLQCPRCSANVPANPGVCANCGENAFQCHKCRAINYDEKDPFLCHACGFCKYAKFDYTLTGRPCCAVDPIENDDDRKKTIATINALLEKADKVYKTLITNKPSLEMLLVKISEHRLDRGLDEGIQVSGNTLVNRAIQLLAQRYCGECKTSFEELSKIIQRVLACRRELVAYDRRQRDQSAAGAGAGAEAGAGTSAGAGAGASASGGSTSTAEGSLATGVSDTQQQNHPSSSSAASESSSKEESTAPVVPPAGRCYGCATAATEHCLTLLRALATNPIAKEVLCKQGLIQELVEHNLRKGTVQMQEEVRQLLCLVTRDNPQSTKELCALLTGRITMTLRGRVAASDLSPAVRHEMALLAALVQKEDSCWEQKLRCVMQLFLMACKESKSPVVMESIILPCLKILQSLVKPEQSSSRKSKDHRKSIESLATVQPPEGITIDVNKWLIGDPKHSYTEWVRRVPARKCEPAAAGKPIRREEARVLYLMEKYGHRWRYRCMRQQPLKLFDGAWLKEVLFNPSSRHAREVACSMIESLCHGTERKKEVLVLLTRYLEELRNAGESSSEFLILYHTLIRQRPWKQFLAVRGVMPLLADLLTREVEELHRLEETTLTSDLAQGYSLKMLTELLSTFLRQENIKQQYKGRLVGAVLNGYLSLRRLVVQRTRLIDETQEQLLELLEEMTTGTEEETKAFMAICVETVQKYSLEDVRTPVFIFERLCSIIYPEENDVGEFFLTLEKDPQQEDFLQGRMLGNPYSSLEPGLGPLMMDVKNKICQDCELVALLEDDNGMELLVNNKIISLDLPVKEVYKKIWVQEGGECDAMRVIYRMRGLLGDATEEFVESLNANSEQEVNTEEVYKMANILAECGGLQVMLNRLAAIQDVNRARPLLQVLLKLFRLSVKVKLNRDVLSKPELGAVTVLLDVLQRCLVSSTESDNSQAKVTEQLLEIMETILANAASQSLASFEAFSRTLGGPEHVKALLSCTQSAAVRQSSSVLAHLARVLAALTYGNPEKMDLLFQYFKPVLNFYEFDFEHTPEDEQKLELFCILTQGIERNAIGNTLKDYIINMGVVQDAFEYIIVHAPCVKPTLRRTDSDELKDFISKPALKYILRFLTGLAKDHEPTQLAVSQAIISIIHRLEQVSSDEHVGSLAENFLEALCTNKRVAELIEEARQHTRSEKKRLAMAMRERQLGALGMQTNDKGQVTASGTILKQMEDLGEETGLVCVICREGYKFKPTMVLGIYTFTKRCNVEEFETKQRKTVGYTTVTHFNVVHVDCHMSAVRLARSRDEWESAALQNANTKCNGLLPLWGPQVLESSYATCLAIHNAYLQECTGHRDISYSATVQDLKLLLLRFAQGKSFHEDTGGGGPQSNMHMVPYLIQMALYVINTTRSATKEEKSLIAYLESTPSAAWLESCYEAEGPYYQCTMSLLLLTPARWKLYRIAHLNRLIVLAHQRHVSPSAATKTIADCTAKNYMIYESALVFFGIVNCIYDNFFKKVNVLSDDQWPSVLSEYIRHNDEALLKASERILKVYREELLPCTSFEEFCDVTGLLEEIPNPSTYMSNILQSLS